MMTVDVSAFHAHLQAVDLDAVPLVCAERHIPRKLQAALARQLFRRLGIKGISVRTPNHSMASSVDVELPKRSDYTADSHGQINFLTDPAAVANREAREKIEAILKVAFPNHDDRSDSQSDHFDFKWSIE